MPLRRMLPFILINVLVSTAVVLLVLYWWDSRDSDDRAGTSTAQLALLETPGSGIFTTPDQPLTDEGGVEDIPATGEEENEEEENGATVHVVQAGETLGVISELYDVSIEDIAAANDIVNVNTISIGQQLIIPIGGLPTETPRPTAAPTVTPTPTAATTEAVEGADGAVEITEVVGVGALTSEAVRISNSGTQPVMLRGWQLEDEDGNSYTFVNVTLYGSSDAGAPSILIHTEAGQNGPSDLYWGQETAVWEAGETVTLRDADGALHVTFDIPPED